MIDMPMWVFFLLLYGFVSVSWDFTLFLGWVFGNFTRWLFEELPPDDISDDIHLSNTFEDRNR